MSNLFNRGPRATAQTLGCAGVIEFNHGIHDVLGRNTAVGARVPFW